MLSMFMPHAVWLWGSADAYAWSGGLPVGELEGIEMSRERAYSRSKSYLNARADKWFLNPGLYTDESPGLKVDPVVVLVLSLGFIFSVVALHSMYTPSVAAPVADKTLWLNREYAKTPITVIAKLTRKFSS